MFGEAARYSDAYLTHEKESVGDMPEACVEGQRDLQPLTNSPGVRELVKKKVILMKPYFQ